MALGLSYIVLIGHWVLGPYALDATSRATAPRPKLLHSYMQYALSMAVTHGSVLTKQKSFLSEEDGTCFSSAACEGDVLWVYVFSTSTTAAPDPRRVLLSCTVLHETAHASLVTPSSSNLTRSYCGLFTCHQRRVRSWEGLAPTIAECNCSRG